MSAVDDLRELLERRIVVLDGAMGTMVQGLGLTDEDMWRGERFKNHAHPLKGCTDVLAVTRPDAIEDIHYQFVRAGADIVGFATVTATSIALADYGLQDAVRDINVAAAQAARRACERAMKADGRQRWVAGSMGPTNKSASLSP